ncbi:MAG: ATP-binding cassette domain-containing protein [Treponema sp.]|jgi:ABC-type multidrug transport system fused ATPase/permease subunit|nr:ATP-binding cassette domain-containing protein [Treponema sp.]
MKPLFTLISLLTPRERGRLIPIFIAVLCSSFFDLIGVGSLGPFVAVLVNPSVVQTQPVLNFFYRTLQFQRLEMFLVFLAVCVFALVLAAMAFKISTLYVVYRFSANRRYSLGLRLFRQYMYQPYSFFLNHNSSELSKSILAEVDVVVDGLLFPVMNTFVYGVLTVTLLVFIIVMNPFVALMALVVFGLTYSLIYIFIKSRLARRGKEVWESNIMRYKYTSEAFGGIKDVKILGKEPFFSYLYSLGVRKNTAAQASQQILSMLPNQAMQSLSIGFTMAMVLVLMFASGSFMQIMPTLAVYAFAIMRIVPGFQTAFQNVTQIRYHRHIVESVLNDMTTLALPPDIPDKQAMSAVLPPFPFTRDLELEKIRFSYQSSREPVLRGIDLRIIKNTTVGLVGATGCGKTTLVDVIMGLLSPSDGSILVDGEPVITSEMHEGPGLSAWQRNFGYVPQQIYLSDDTVAANIAFGIPEDMRDSAAIERAARIANLHDFIAEELPGGYNTLVGERGVRLSGGQRQRIGIARSLYHDPNILVMDEATSALDSITEDAVMDAIHNLLHSKTVIIIAHRLSTVQECDMVCLMEKGLVTAQGTYDELIKSNSRFRAMAKVGK